MTRQNETTKKLNLPLAAFLCMSTYFAFYLPLAYKLL